MSVMFKTQSLIEAAQSILDRKKAAGEEWEAMLAEYYDEHYDTWFKNHTEGVRELRDYLTKCLKERKNPDQATALGLMAQKDYLRFYSKPSSPNGLDTPAGLNPGHYVGSLPGLIRMLKAHTGDTITANELKLVGYDKLTHLFAAAAEAGGRI